MYTTFSLAPNKTRRRSKDDCTPANQPRAKRMPVPVACDYCRKNRIKCNNSKPCDNCRSRNLACSHVDTTETRGLIRQVQVLVGKVEDLESRLWSAQNGNANAEQQAASQIQLRSPPSSTGSTIIPSTSSPPSNSDIVAEQVLEEPHSALDLSSDCFATKVDALLQRRNFPTTVSVTLVTSTHASFSGRDKSRCGIDSVSFPRNQQDYYIRLYWRQIHRNLPVVNEDAFKAHYSSLWDRGISPDSRLSSSLVDMVLALALQLDFYSRPGGSSRHVVPQNGHALDWTWSTADTLYRSCSDELNQECESPSWSTLQCHILMVIYLRNEGRHNSAYQVLGSAIRLSHVLGLHQTPPPSTPWEDLRLRDQMRDFLICLDTQQFLEQARPCGIMECVPRQHIPLDPLNRCFWSYWSELMSIAKSIYLKLLGLKTNDVNSNRHHSPGGAMHQAFESPRPALMEPLSAWAKNVPPRHQIRRKSGGAPFSLDYMIEVDVDVPIWQLRQCLLLELSFHWVNMNLLRWFIDPDHGSARKESTAMPTISDTHCESAVGHAIAIVGIFDQALRNTDAIYGWYDSHLIQWDATLVLICFLLCRPEHAKAEEASLTLSKCVSSFEALGTRLPCQAAMVIKEFSTHIKPGMDSSYQQLPDSNNTHLQHFSFANDYLSRMSGLDQHLIGDAFDTDMNFDLDLVDLSPSNRTHASLTS